MKVILVETSLISRKSSDVYSVCSKWLWRKELVVKDAKGPYWRQHGCIYTCVELVVLKVLPIYMFVYKGLSVLAIRTFPVACIVLCIYVCGYLLAMHWTQQNETEAYNIVRQAGGTFGTGSIAPEGHTVVFWIIHHTSAWCAYSVQNIKLFN